jgi:hypothetical protein
MEKPHLRGPGTAECLDRLDAEHDNLRAALAWSLETGEAALGLRVAGILAWFWRLRGHLREGRHWLGAVLAASREVRTPLRVRALNGLGLLTYSLGDTIPDATIVSTPWTRRIGVRRCVPDAIPRLVEAGIARRYQNRLIPPPSRYRLDRPGRTSCSSYL